MDADTREWILVCILIVIIEIAVLIWHDTDLSQGITFLAFLLPAWAGLCILWRICDKIKDKEKEK